MKSEFLKAWERETSNLAEYFSARYFGNGVTDSYWVADDVGGVYVIADYFFSVNDMVDFIKYSYSKENMFEYYDYALENFGKNPICIRDYKKLK